MNKEVKLKKIGNEKIKIITRLDGQIDYFLKVDNTGYLENDWLALPEKEFNQIKEGGKKKEEEGWKKGKSA